MEPYYLYWNWTFNLLILDEERINSASIVIICLLPESECCPFKELSVRRGLMAWHHTPDTLPLAPGMGV